MTQLTIVTTPTNSGDGTPLATAFNYCNSNFNELYARFQVDPPASLIGTTGDVPGMYAVDSTYFYYCFAAYDGSSTIWGQVTQVGNITISSIVNGTSNISISSANANATISVNGSSNVAVFSTLGVTVNGIASISGNVTGGNIRTAGQVSATGNITGSYFLGNGSQLTGLPATYGNANVAAFLPTYTGTLSPVGIYTDGYYYANSVPVTFGGGGGSSYGNANVADFLPTYSGNLGGTLTTASQTNITTVGNLTGLTVNGLTSVTLSPVAASVTIAPTFGGTVVVNPAGIGSINNMVIGATTPVAGSFTTVSASGNITATYFIGDGSQITNLPIGNYSNTNVASYLTTFTGNLSAGNISVTGTTTSSLVGDVTGTVSGQLYGLVNGVNPDYGTWDFGYITANTYTNPLQWIFAQTSLGNIDMGTVTAPASYEIDIGTIF
jgi:hypothetical protein